KAAALLAEILVGRATRRRGQREQRDQAWSSRVAIVEEAREVERLVATFGARFGGGEQEAAIPQRQHGVQRLRAGGQKRRTEGQLADELGIADIADVEIDHCRRVAHGRELAVGADIGGPPETLPALSPLVSPPL